MEGKPPGSSSGDHLRNGLVPKKPPPGRLLSFKGQRDLTLGGSNRGAGAGAATAAAAASSRKFVPNLNVQRVKKEEPSQQQQQQQQHKGDGPVNRRGGGRGGRGNHHNASQTPGAHGGGGATPASSKGRSELIQTMGSVFSDGLNTEGFGIRRKGGGFRSESGNGDAISGRASSSMTLLKVDKEEEDRRLQALMRDDFIDDGDFGTGLFVPVQLPMINTGKVFKEEKVEDDGEELKSSQLMRSRKKRQQILDSDDDDDDSGASSKMQVDTVIADKVQQKEDGSAELTFPDLVKHQRGDLLFIQLPDHLPGRPTLPPKEMPEVKREKGVEAPAIPAATDFVPSGSKCTVQDLPEGYLGKIQIRRSGKTQLVIGEESFDIDMGTQVGFLQDLVSVRVGDAQVQGTAVGDMTVLGHVKHRVVVTPNWDSLFECRDRAAKR